MKGVNLPQTARAEKMHSSRTAFALNLDIENKSDARKRIELGKASLKALAIL